MDETIDLTNIDSLVGYLNGIIDKGISTPQSVPSPLILLGAVNKKGLSAREITKEVITKSQSFGVPIGNLPDGSESVSEKMIYVMVETILEHIIKNAKITVVIPPGIPVTTTGVAGVIPVVTQGATINYATGYAIIQ